MASSLPSSILCSSILMKHSLKQASPIVLKVRAHSHKDEGKSSDIVDASLSILRERMKEIRTKEKAVKRCCKMQSKNGWNYATGYNYRPKKEMMNSFGCLEVAGFLVWIFGITFLSGTSFISLVYILVHFTHYLNSLRL